MGSMTIAKLLEKWRAENIETILIEDWLLEEWIGRCTLIKPRSFPSGAFLVLAIHRIFFPGVEICSGRIEW